MIDIVLITQTTYNNIITLFSDSEIFEFWLIPPWVISVKLAITQVQGIFRFKFERKGVPVVITILSKAEKGH